MSNVAAAPRKMPTQKRSRDRVEKMLTTAGGIIVAKGSDGMSMSEVARGAGVSLASLYQFFPDKSALLRTLAERSNEECRHCIQAAFAEVSTVAELLSAFNQLIEEYYEIFLSDPLIRAVRAATQADKSLHDVDLADARANGALLVEAWARVCPDQDAEELEAAAFTVINLGDAAMRLAVSVPRAEGDRIVAAYQRMALAELGRHGR